MRYLTPAYLTLHIIGGHVGLPLLVATLLFSKRVHRPPAVINLLVTWIVFSVSYCLLLYTGPLYSRHPSFALCLAQAAFIHATPPMSVLAVFAVVLQVWHLFQPPWHPWWSFVGRIPPRLRFLLIIAPPYVAFVAISLATIFIGLNNRPAVTSSLGIYCTIDLEVFFAIPLFCAVFMILILLFNVGTIVQHYWRRRQVSQLQITHHTPSINVWLRVLIFNLYSVATLGACLLFLISASDPLPYMIQAGLPLVAVLIFGSQKDIFRAWRFWGRTQSSANVHHLQATESSDGGWSPHAEANQLSSVDAVIDISRGRTGDIVRFSVEMRSVTGVLESHQTKPVV